jgi:hypothetical protein
VVGEDEGTKTLVALFDGKAQEDSEEGFGESSGCPSKEEEEEVGERRSA